ncbi:unnamed protein product [Mytilus edulis]|uniref:Uncharacterized protein n=1 Tax=Mytilus edulis TaxID=6550 RepID=A0A8S3S537_MYTED|nr:unnamed protein product [Mytilus edulis]
MKSPRFQNMDPPTDDCADKRPRLEKGSFFKSFRKDLFWWYHFLKSDNGVSMMALDDWSQPDEILETDATLSGCESYNGVSVDGFRQIFRLLRQMPLLSGCGEVSPSDVIKDSTETVCSTSTPASINISSLLEMFPGKRVHQYDLCKIKMCTNISKDEIQHQSKKAYKFSMTG